MAYDFSSLSFEQGRRKIKSKKEAPLLLARQQQANLCIPMCWAYPPLFTTTHKKAHKCSSSSSKASGSSRLPVKSEKIATMQKTQKARMVSLLFCLSKKCLVLFFCLARPSLRFLWFGLIVNGREPFQFHSNGSSFPVELKTAIVLVRIRMYVRMHVRFYKERELNQTFLSPSFLLSLPIRTYVRTYVYVRGRLGLKSLNCTQF